MSDTDSIASESSGGYTEIVQRKTAMAGAGVTDKALEDKYKKHTLLTHIREIPDTYIGSIEPHPLTTYLYNPETKRFAEETITYVPGFYKIFDEVLVNALDQVARLTSDIQNGKTDVRPVKTIKVAIDRATGWITITNDGDGIDVEKHPNYDNIWIPELIFGELLTGTNYDTSEERLWGGKNGYGAKLANIFSKEFIVETIDHRRKKMYSQRFYDNMEHRDKAVVKAAAKAPYTSVKFLPDYARFGLKGLDADTVKLFERRVYDACATTPTTVAVYFNDAKLDIKDFEKYADFFIGSKDEKPRAVEAATDRWEVLATVSDDGQFHQVSFVNGINTLKGGRHVDYITNQITKKLVEIAATKKKKDIKPQHIKDNLWLFVKASIVNPAFDSQTKENLTTQVAKFGSKCELSDKFYDRLIKTGILDKAVSLTEFHEKKKFTKTDGKKTSRIFVPKLDDANDAGTKNSRHCTLILTEGDSAKSMAIAGLSVVGRDRYGVFPLRGKILNVKDVTTKKIMENEEITNLKKILGLTQGKEYASVDDLRYGKIMIMTDQDSVVGDTPLLLRHPDGHVEIRTIDDLATTEWASNPNGKDYAQTDYQAWTDKGWTSIRHVMRHKTTKRIYRILTHTGCVDATEDHSLLSPAGEKLRPTDIRVGTPLLHHFPPSDTLHRPQSPPTTQMGYYPTKLAAMKAYYAARQAGAFPIVSLHTEGGNTLYRLAPRALTAPVQNEQTVVDIIDLGTTEQYVYDLETENHHFHAGVGQMIVHNTDGYHIRGLLFNVFQTLWPSLFEMKDFLTSMLTPIVKVSHTNGTSIEFHNLTDYEHWKTTTGATAAGLRGWTIKYYKGLGTSTAEEAKKYFKDLKTLEYTYNGKSSDEGIDLAFNKSRADDRKEWLTKTYDRNRVLDYSKKQIPYETFVNDELIHFSNYDLERSIPSMVDGLKVSTRKVLFGCFKKKLYTREIRVSQLSGYISEHAMYHHGETSLQQAIVGMAQNFVGANNIHYLQPNGQFGTRIQGGKDSASPRYIHTLLSPMARKIYREADAPILHYLDDDGVVVEPDYYVPIIPSVLVNGGLGIGTGFSTNIPCHNPTDVIQLCRTLIQALDAHPTAIDTPADLPAAFERLEKVELPTIHPWYLGFKGTLAETKPGVYQSTGCWKWLSDERLEITELPIGTWTEDYKEFLTATVADGSPVLRDFESHYTEHSVHFILHFYPGVRASVEKNLESDFKLVSSKNLNLNNIHLFDRRGIIRKYADAVSIVREWATIRLEAYLSRKTYQLGKMEAEYKILSAKVRFIQDVISGKINLMNQKMKDIEAQLTKLGYPKLYEATASIPTAPDDAAPDADAAPTGPADYEYLVRMPMKQLTQERKLKLEKEASDLDSAIQTLRKTPIQRLWLNELEELSADWEAYRAAHTEHQEANTPAAPPGQKAKKPRGRASAPEAKPAKPTKPTKAKAVKETKPKAKADAKPKAAKAKSEAKPKAKADAKPKTTKAVKEPKK